MVFVGCSAIVGRARYICHNCSRFAGGAVTGGQQVEERIKRSIGLLRLSLGVFWCVQRWLLRLLLSALRNSLTFI